MECKSQMRLSVACTSSKGAFIQNRRNKAQSAFVMLKPISLEEKNASFICLNYVCFFSPRACFVWTRIKSTHLFDRLCSYWKYLVQIIDHPQNNQHKTRWRHSFMRTVAFGTAWAFPPFLFQLFNLALFLQFSKRIV